MIQTDFLVVGSGIAGLTYALKMAQRYPGKKVTVITKTRTDETNTKYAQGGIAGVWDNEKDSFDKHIEDTLIAGDVLVEGQAAQGLGAERGQRARRAVGIHVSGRGQHAVRRCGQA